MTNFEDKLRELAEKEEEIRALRARLTEAGRRCSELEARLDAAEKVCNALLNFQEAGDWMPDSLESTEKIMWTTLETWRNSYKSFGGRDD